MLRKSIFFYSVSGKNPSEKLTKNRFYYNINVKFLMEERILKTKKLLSLFLAALMVFSFSGCKIIEDITKFTGLVSEIFEDNKEQEEPDEEPEPIVPDDPNWPANAFGITLEKAPEKVAVASPALAEYISDMGLFEKICAAADFCGFPGAEEKPSIGSVSLPDMEAIKTAAPEYILTFAQYEESLLIKLQQRIAADILRHGRGLHPEFFFQKHPDQQKYWYSLAADGIVCASGLDWNIGQDGTGKFGLKTPAKISRFRFWDHALTTEELQSLTD